MKTQARLLRLASLTTALFCALALPAARTSSARQDGSRGARSVTIKAEDGKELQLYERSYALVIGVSDYARGWPKLPGVREDVEEVARALERHGFLVTKVENPDSAQLEKSFKEFIDAHGLGVENRLLFYFAGHGHTIKQSYDEEMGYIVPADAPHPDQDRAGFMSKAMDMHQMELYARRIQSKHALFLFDSCFSGALFALSRAASYSIGYKTARPVREFITSGSAGEQVPDRSIFRRQFVEALGGEADLNRDGYVTGIELGEFLQDKVINYSRNAQHPQYGKIRNPNLDKGDFVFALLKPPAPAAGSVGLSPDPPARVDPTPAELAFWDTIKNSSDQEDFKEYLEKYPAGQFVGVARRRLATLAAGAGGASPTDSPAARPAAEELPYLYRSAEGRYNVLLPAQPQFMQKELSVAPGINLQQYWAFAHQSDTIYMIAYYEYDSARMEFSFDHSRKTMLANTKGKLLAEQAIILGGIPGRELKIASKIAGGAEVITRIRVYDTGRRVYFIQIVTPKTSESVAYSQKAAKFFDSFQIVTVP